MVATVTRELVSVNPATLEPVGSVRRTEPGELPGIVASARAAQERWRALGPAARARVLREAARVVLAQADEIVDTIVAETAKPRTEAVADELSAAVDHRVAAAAGARGCPVVLELGGKDPMVVFADADLDRAVDGALYASFLNAGQACVSAERIYVERAIYEEFVQRLSRRARELRLGDEVGPLISERQRDTVERLTGAERPQRDGWFLEPTVIREG